MNAHMYICTSESIPGAESVMLHNLSYARIVYEAHCEILSVRNTQSEARFEGLLAILA
jgi:hypothetical protein